MKGKAQKRGKLASADPKPAPAAMTLTIKDAHWREHADVSRVVRRAAKLALAIANAPAGRSELTILLTDDAQMRALNRRFRGKRTSTNVLSFPSPDGPYLGDIAIAYGVVAREARARDISLAAHAAHLAAHGVLHLLGYDHQDEPEAMVMEALEGRILVRLGLADPYASAGKAA